MALEASPLPVSAADARAPGLGVTLLLLVVSVGFALGGQLMLKAAMDEIGRIGAHELASMPHTVARAGREPRLWIGLSLFGISAMFWLVVLSRVPLSFAYPFVGMSYVLVVLFSRLWLGEHVPALRWIGVFVIMVGIAIVGFSFPRAST